MTRDKDVRRLERQIAGIKRDEEKERKRKKDERRDKKVRRRDGHKPVKKNDKNIEKVLSSRVLEKLEKKRLIENRLKEYTRPELISKDVDYVPDDIAIKEYTKILNGLRIEQLRMMGRMRNTTLKLDLMDRLKSLNKKEHAVVTIFNDNKTTDTGVIQCYDRTFVRNGMCYMIMGERSIFDPEFKMAHFYYYANHTCPIIFQKGRLPDNAYDAKLIADTIQMKVIEALAAIDMDKFIKIILVIVAVMLLLIVADTVLMYKIAGALGAGV